MEIINLKLFNYRNHKKKEINFAHTNIVFGANGSGKTSILEALTLLSTTRSNRTNKTKEIINWDTEDSFLELVIKKNKEKKTIRLILDNKNNHGKTFSLNGKIFPPKDIIGEFLTVYFAPESLDIITGNPNKRRRFLDILISQTDKSYLSTLIKFKKTLLNRNKILKDLSLNKKDKKEIVFWDQELINTSSLIMKKRKKTCKALNVFLLKHHKKIIKRKQKTVLQYTPSVVQKNNHKDIKEAFTERLAVDFDLELRYGNTLYGPHRDDVRFLVSGKDAALYSSRGEIRSLIIALKLAEMDYIIKKKTQKPVVLLDDMYSELDAKRESHLMDFILKIPQTVITTSNKKIAKSLSKKGARLIKLNKIKSYA